MNRIITRLVLPVGVATALGAGGFAFMAGNTMAPSYAGDGNSPVSGYDVTNISYNTSNTFVPSIGNFPVESVSFDLDHGAKTANVRAILGDSQSGHSYYKCAPTNAPAAAATSGPANWTCAISNPPGGYVTLKSIISLEVVAGS